MLRRASTKIAHNSTIPVLGASQDLKPLQNLIIAEKAVLLSFQKLSVDYLKASDALRAWGLSEGNDLGDILSASSSLLKIFSSALLEYASHGDFMRKQLKVIRTKEESLDNLKRCRRNARRKAKNVDKKLSKMALDSKNSITQKESLFHLQEEIRKMDAGVMFEETALHDFKRTATKAWMGLKFGGLVECCQKGTIAGEFGKLAISRISEETTRHGMPRLSPPSDSQGLVQEADRYVNAVALSIIPSERFHDGDQQFPNSPTSLVSSSEPQQPSSTLRGGNAESNPPVIQPIRRRKGQPPETLVNSSSEYPYAPPYVPQPTQGTSSSQTLPSEPQQQPSGNEAANLQPIRRRKGHPPEMPVSPVNPSSEYPPYVPLHQSQPSQGTVHSSSSQPLTPEPQQQPSPTSTLRGSNEGNPQSTKPVRRRKGDPPETPVAPVHSSSEYPPYVPPYQLQPSQGTAIHSPSSQPLPSSQQQPGVNEGAVNGHGCAVHRNNTVHTVTRNNTSSRLPTSPVNSPRQPTSSSKSRYQLQDPPSSGGRHRIGDASGSSLAGTLHLTPNRFNEWSQSSEDSRLAAHALYHERDDPPPSFHDALMSPVVGSRREIASHRTREYP